MEEGTHPFVEALMHVFNTFKEMFLAFLGVLPKAISLFLWVISAVFILPCVFVAGHIYPKWVEWGEDF